MQRNFSSFFISPPCCVLLSALLHCFQIHSLFPYISNHFSEPAFSNLQKRFLSTMYVILQYASCRLELVLYLNDSSILFGCLLVLWGWFFFREEPRSMMVKCMLCFIPFYSKWYAGDRYTVCRIARTITTKRNCSRSLQKIKRRRNITVLSSYARKW